MTALSLRAPAATKRNGPVALAPATLAPVVMVAAGAASVAGAIALETGLVAPAFLPVALLTLLPWLGGLAAVLCHGARA